MNELDTTLAAVLDLAREIQTETREAGGHSTLREPADFIRYAVLKRIEDPYNGGLDLDVIVKYGDADAMFAEKGTSTDPVWAATPADNDHTLFRVEEYGDVSDEEWVEIDRTMLAIGAFKVGRTRHKIESNEHTHYVWPDDHHVTKML